MAQTADARTASTILFGTPSVDPVELTTGVKPEVPSITSELATYFSGLGEPAKQPVGSCEGGFSPPPVRVGMSGASASRREALWPHVWRAACRHGVSPALLDSLVLAESMYSHDAISKAGAAGLAQLMPATARELGVQDRFDPDDNLHGGAKYLRQMLDRFSSVPLALAAYNAGPGAVERAGRIPRNDETPAYVSRVLSFLAAADRVHGEPSALRRALQIRWGDLSE
jgi:soluble lytic murein transglycosylase-like protein